MAPFGPIDRPLVLGRLFLANDQAEMNNRSLDTTSGRLAANELIRSDEMIGRLVSRFAQLAAPKFSISLAGWLFLFARLAGHLCEFGHAN